MAYRIYGLEQGRPSYNQEITLPDTSQIRCPLKNGAAMLDMSPQELIEGPKARQLAFCVDSRIASEGNPVSGLPSDKRL